ncbi:MAG: HhH-GPD-type base excision DNA repair protein [Kineosporiaceae bacterium]
MTTVRLALAQEPAADELLSRDPFALLVGMLLDQQFPMERAFAGPALIAERLGVDRLDPAQLASQDEQAFVALMTGPPAVHRYPGSMAGRVVALAQHIVEHYDGDAAALWSGAADGAELLARLKALPGFGQQKASIFLALLGKQLGVRPAGWERAAGDYALDGYRSVADVTDATSLQKVRDHKRAVKEAAKAARR